jgi:hypothetical protein
VLKTSSSVLPRPAPTAARTAPVGFGRIVVSDREVPNILVSLI